MCLHTGMLLACLSSKKRSLLVILFACILAIIWSPLLSQTRALIGSLPFASGSALTRAMSGGGTSFSVVYVTAPTTAVARQLARVLVGPPRCLAACVNIVPQVVSVYEWQGSVQEDSEVLMVIKTRSELVSELTDVVTQHHPYDVPEVIALPIHGGSPSYLKWLSEATENPQ